MAKVSAGILLYRKYGENLEVLLVHPGGPFWGKKDDGAWSMPKGEVGEGEELLVAAKREFQEELGLRPPEGDYRGLGYVKLKGGKVVHAWVALADLDVSNFKSKNFTMEWPMGSGREGSFPEVDKAQYFNIETARVKMNTSQAVFLDLL